MPLFGSYGGQIHVPDYSGIAKAGAIRAQGDAALGQAIGQAIGDFGKAFFEKKKQKKLAESMAENPIVMEAVYGPFGEDSQVPIDRETRVKDVTALIRSGGGTEKFIARIDRLKAQQQQQQRLDLAEERAAAAERRAQGLYDQGEKDRKGMREFLKLIFPKPTGPEYFEAPRFTDPAQKPPERRVSPPAEVGETRVLDSGSIVRGSRIVGGGGRSETRPIINVATGEVTQPVPPPLAERAAELSPEGQELAYARLVSQQAGEAALQDKMRLEQFKADLDSGKKGPRDLSGSRIVNDAVARADKLISGLSTGYGAFLKGVPGTDAKALDSLFETIRANIGFDKLQAMREASPTGGALGQVSERELIALQAVFGNLDQAQSKEQLRYNMRLLQHEYNNVIHGVGEHPFKAPGQEGAGGGSSAVRSAENEAFLNSSGVEAKMGRLQAKKAAGEPLTEKEERALLAWARRHEEVPRPSVGAPRAPRDMGPPRYAPVP